MKTIQPRMKNPAEVLVEANQPVQALFQCAFKSGVPATTLGLVHLRVSLINGCASCVDGGTKQAVKSGETSERLFAVGVWRDTPYYTDAERAALALAECVTRLNDRADPVPDDVWAEATRHYNETQLAGLLVAIATTNVFNRFNVPTRQVAGQQHW